MVDFNLTVLGANSAIPVPGRFSSSFVLTYNYQSMLIDCGEGAQIKMSEFGIKKSRIDFVFISHLHGDHIYGLPGFLGSLGLSNRKNPLHIYGPFGLKGFIEAAFQVTEGRASYELIFHEFADHKVYDLGEINGLKVTAFPLKHRIPTFGYRFDELPQPYKIKSSAISEYVLTIEEMKSIKSGQPIFRNGLEVPLELVSDQPAKLRSFAYCSDTVFDEELPTHIANIGLLYHEATYLHDLVDKAHERMHSTALEAGLIAQKANATRLILGHYSSRYKNLDSFIKEVQPVFNQVELAEEGKNFDVM